MERPISMPASIGRLTHWHCRADPAFRTFLFPYIGHTLARMATILSSEASRTQLAAVGLALALATLTFILPTVVATILFTCLVSFAAGAEALHRTHGLDPGSFSAGFYLAALLLLGVGAWQGSHSVRAWLAGRAERKEGLDPPPDQALAPARLKGWPASLTQRPWILLGLVLLVIDASLVRWEIRGQLNSPDGLLAAAILASMVWTTVFIAVSSVRLTGRLWRLLLARSRRSPYMAGLVTAFSLAISLASVLVLRSDFRGAAEPAFEQEVVRSIDKAPTTDAPIEQIRLALVEFAEPSRHEPTETQPLIKEAAPQTPPVLPASAPIDPTAEAPASDRALGIVDTDSAGLMPAETPPAEKAAEAVAPAAVVPAAAASSDAYPPFLNLAFGPPGATCVDRLTEKKFEGDPILLHTRRIMARFGISEHDARAVVIETLVSVCAQKADDREDLSRYFSRSVTNAARNFVTRQLNGRRLCSIELVPVIDYPDESNDWHFANETEQRAQQAFCKLSELDQAIIQARVLEDLKFWQIGEMVGLGEDGARKAFDRALRRLKENFEKN